MAKKNIPTPVCSTCGKSGTGKHAEEATFYLCEHCGTEMRYLPAGELLQAGGAASKNNGWITKFSVLSSELYFGRVTFAIGVLVLLLTLSFLFFGKIESEHALWTACSGLVLIIIGKRKSISHKQKVRKALTLYPYWKK